MVRYTILYVVALFACAALALAQEPKPEKRDVQQGFILEITATGDKVVETVGAYLTEDEAELARKQWYARNPKSLYLAVIRKGDVEVKRQPASKPKPSDPLSPATASKGTTIVPSIPKFVDPGAIKNGDKLVPTLAGRKGTGMIGKSKVTIEFTGEGKSGEFTVSGEQEGKGQWKLLGKFIFMETKRAKFDGTVVGDKISGTRKLKEDGEKDKWALSLLEVRRIDETAKIYFVEVKAFYSDGIQVKKGDDGWYRYGIGYDEKRKEDPAGTIKQARDLLKEKKHTELIQRRSILNKYRIVDKDGRVIE